MNVGARAANEWQGIELETPIGKLRLDASDSGLRRIEFVRTDRDLPCNKGHTDHPILAQAAVQLSAYFAGTLTRFSVPLQPVGSAFQRSVWEALLAIRYGETRSYGQIARALGMPTASRAVGAANGQNPLAIVVPCHRVIGAGGNLTGYAGGLERKRWLLRHEARQQS